MLHSELFDSVFFDKDTQPTKNIVDSNLDKKLDIVYTFVNTNDPTWRIKHDKHSKKYDSHRYDPSHIEFSLKTLNKYFPNQYLNKIYLVSDYHRLNISSKLIPNIYNKIIYIDHEDIIPKNFLPTFNSMVIEAFLWNIKDLKENFIYLNDDIILAKNISISDFFDDKSKKAIQFFTRCGKSSHPWYVNIKKSNELFAKKFNINPNVCPQHAPYHILKSEYKYVYDIFSNELNFMFHNHKTRNYQNSHNLIFLYGMHTTMRDICINKRTSFRHIFRFTPEFVSSTIEEKNRSKFYAISSHNMNNTEQLFFQKFQRSILC